MITTTTHRHPDGTEWVHSWIGKDSHGKEQWSWNCINPDGTEDEYPCNDRGWIDFKKHPPKKPEILAVLNLWSLDGDFRYQRADVSFHDGKWNETLESVDFIDHWIPQSENPQ